MLKGAVLCKKYPKGYRTSNDIDLLVCPERVTQIGKALIKEGFRQGDIRNGTFIPASRKEIIESRMTRGETIPYIKEVNLPGKNLILMAFMDRHFVGRSFLSIFADICIRKQQHSHGWK